MITQRKSLAQEVAELIQEDIKKGIYTLNEKLPTEPEFMKKFGVGRSTVREAIKYLVQSGYVNVLQGIGTFVISSSGNTSMESTLHRADFAELLEVRQLLEIKIAEKAAINRKNDDLSRINTYLKKRDKYAQEGMLAECFQADIDFHTAIAQSCGNQLLYELYRTLSQKLTKFYFDIYSDTEIFISTQTLHEELYKYIKAKDPLKTLKVVNKIIGTI